jgi:uncharacterized membrane protein YccC
VTQPQFHQISEAIAYGVSLAVSYLLSCWLVTRFLAHVYSVSRDDDLLGGIWATVATVFVYRYSYEQSVCAALSRMAATSVSFVLCLVYLLIFPFQPWGMAILIGIGAVVTTLIGQPDDTVTTGITTTVVMVVAALSPHNAWREPILRMVDTAVGVGVGIAGARIILGATRRHQRAAPNQPALDKGGQALVGNWLLAVRPTFIPLDAAERKALEASADILKRYIAMLDGSKAKAA